MAALAVEDIVKSTDTADAAFFLSAAQAAVRRFCGWHVAPSTEVEGAVPSSGGRILRLPLMAVTSLDELVSRDGTDLLASCSWTWGGLVELSKPVEAGVAAVSFRATAGFDPADVPDLCSVIMQAARRASQSPAGSVKSQSVNGASVTYGFSGDGAPMVSLLASERDVLASYRLPRLP